MNMIYPNNRYFTHPNWDFRDGAMMNLGREFLWHIVVANEDHTTSELYLDNTTENIDLIKSQMSNIAHISFPVSCSEIPENFFTGCVLPYVNIPITIKKIGANAFKDSHIPVLKYDGTSKDWTYVQLDENWNPDYSVSNVECKDEVDIIYRPEDTES